MIFKGDIQQEDEMTKMTSLEKRQFIHVLEGLKQGLKASLAQNKLHYLGFSTR